MYRTQRSTCVDRLSRPAYQEACNDYTCCKRSRTPNRSPCQSSPNNISCEDSVEEPHVIQVPYDVEVIPCVANLDKSECSDLSRPTKPINVQLNLKFIPQEIPVTRNDENDENAIVPRNSCENKIGKFDCLFSNMNETLRDIRTGIDSLKETQRRLLGNPCTCKGSTSQNSEPKSDCPETCNKLNNNIYTCNMATYSSPYPNVNKRMLGTTQEDRACNTPNVETQVSCFQQFKNFWSFISCYKERRRREGNNINYLYHINNPRPELSSYYNNKTYPECTIDISENHSAKTSGLEGGCFQLTKPCSNTINKSLLYHAINETEVIYGPDKSKLLYTKDVDTTQNVSLNLKKKKHTKNTANKLIDNKFLDKFSRDHSSNQIADFNTIRKSPKDTEDELVNIEFENCAELMLQDSDLSKRRFNRIMLNNLESDYNRANIYVNQKQNINNQNPNKEEYINIKNFTNQRGNEENELDNDDTHVVGLMPNSSRNIHDESSVATTSNGIICGSAKAVNENIAERCRPTNCVSSSFRQFQKFNSEIVHSSNPMHRSDRNHTEELNADNRDIMQYPMNQTYQENSPIPVRNMFDNFKVFDEIKMIPKKENEKDRTSFSADDYERCVLHKSSKQYNNYKGWDTNPIRLTSTENKNDAHEQRIEQGTDNKPEKLKQKILPKHIDRIVHHDKPTTKLTDNFTDEAIKETKHELISRFQHKNDTQKNITKTRVKSADCFDKGNKSIANPANIKHSNKDLDKHKDAVGTALESMINALTKPLFEIPHTLPFVKKPFGVSPHFEISNLISKQTSTEITTNEMYTQSISEGSNTVSAISIQELSEMRSYENSSSNELKKNGTFSFDSKNHISEASLEEHNVYENIVLPPHNFAETMFLLHKNESLNVTKSSIKDSSMVDTKVGLPKTKSRCLDNLQNQLNKGKVSKNTSTTLKPSDNFTQCQTKRKSDIFLPGAPLGSIGSSSVENNMEVSNKAVKEENTIIAASILTGSAANSSTKSDHFDPNIEQKNDPKAAAPTTKLGSNVEENFNKNNLNSAAVPIPIPTPTPMFTLPSNLIYTTEKPEGFPSFVTLNTQNKENRTSEISNKTLLFTKIDINKSSLKARVPIIMSHLKNAKYELCLARASASGLSTSYSQRKIDEALLHNRKITNKIIEYPRKSTIKLSRIKESLFDVILSQSSLYRPDKSIPRVITNRSSKLKNRSIHIHSVPNGSMLLKSIKKQIAIKGRNPFQM